jgi:cellulose synthase/poly-beta-1,6-N-acetylglucosamine synthase-like glycosyltransferase
MTPTQLNLWGIFGLLVDFFVLVMLLFLPTRRRGRQDDRGDGIAHCVLPAHPRKGQASRALLFFLIGAALDVLIIAAEHWLTYEYRSLIAITASWAVPVHQYVDPLVGKTSPTVSLLVAMYFVCMACCVRGGLARRAALASNAVLLLGLTTTVDVALTVVGASTNGSVAPSTLSETLAALCLGFLVFVRMTVTTFMLPKPTALQNRRPRWVADRLMMGLALVAGASVAVGLLSFIRQPSNRGGVPSLFLSFFVFSGFFTTIAVFLFAARWLGSRPPAYLNPPPPIDVIVAAYNEEDIIRDNLLAIDRAAAYYGGPVHVILVDDGSVDSTPEVARAVFDSFTAATGSVVSRPNGGIARAYNTALEHATADYIVRVDADTLIDYQALPNIVRWLPIHEVGQVSALYLPRTDLPESWFHRMRLFECLFGFGFARQGHSIVDGVVCAPGPLAAYRRDVAFEIGGYTFGMNGEDLDFTNKVGRSGYRVILDPKIIAYEDVPYSFSEFRGQRHRWSRAGIHCFARFSPFSSGLAGVRTWFTFPRLISTRFTGPLRLLIVLHAVLLSILHPSYRHTIVIAAVLYLCASLPTFVVASLLMLRYGFASKILWLLAWYPFLVLRRFFVLEGFLSLPTRPAFALSPVSDQVRIRRLFPALDN